MADLKHFVVLQPVVPVAVMLAAIQLGIDQLKVVAAVAELVAATVQS